MRYDEAQKEARATGCRHAIAVTTKPLPMPKPRPSQDAQVVCKYKIRQGQLDDLCAEGQCPLGRR